MAITNILSTFLHIDKFLGAIIAQYGFLTYFILFLIIFLETGVVFTPLLPGDSLIFAAGTLAAQNILNVYLLFFLLSAAAILGDSVNYWIGHHFGKRAFTKDNAKFLKKEYLERTNQFYEKHGARTIILARFIPIIRTFAPFVAGMGKMKYSKFFKYNLIGGISWVALFVFGGYLLGNIPIVKQNFGLVIIFIIVISIVPVIIELIKKKMNKHTSEPLQN